MNRINKRLPKICGVCGNRAMGHNFGALSCEPCKAFFRRNAFRDNLKCHFNSNCKITEITRKFCSKCRLDKCFAVGMRRDWMPCEDKCETQTDDSCVQNDGLYSEDSSTKSVTNSQDSDNNDILYDLLDINSDNKFSREELNAQIVDLEGIVANNLQGSPNSETPTNEYNGYQCSCSEPLPPDTCTDLDDVSDDIIQKSVEFEFAVIPIARPIAEYKCNFNETESFMLNELFGAVKWVGVQRREHITSDITNVTDIHQTMVQKFENAIRNTTRALRQVTPFRTMCESDQISLLKYGCIEIIYLRSILSFNSMENGLELSMDSDRSRLLRLEAFKQYNSHAYQGYINFMKKIVPIWDSDQYIIDLMTPIVVFNPERSNLINPDAIKLQQHIYMYLLQRYLVLKYPSECEAKSRFLRLMNTTNDLKVLRNIQKSDISDYQAKQHETPVGPLLQECLDIKPNPTDYSLTIL